MGLLRLEVDIWSPSHHSAKPVVIVLRPLALHNDIPTWYG